MSISVNLRLILLTAVAITLPLFWIRIFSIGGFDLDVSFISYCISVFSIFVCNDDLKCKQLWMVLLIVILFLVLYSISIIIYGMKSTFVLFIVQSYMIISFYQIGRSIFILNNNYDNVVEKFIIIMNFSLFAAIFYCGFNQIGDLIDGILKFKPASVVSFTRNVFGYSYLREGFSLNDITNLHNRVAQYSFGFSYLTLALCGKIRSKKLRLLIAAMSICIIVFSVMLLSGQVFAEVLITLAFCILYFLLRGKFSIILSMFFSLIFSFCTFAIYFNDTLLWKLWEARFTGDNISTGRLSIWSDLLSKIDLTDILIGTSINKFSDSHNLFIAFVVELGLLGLFIVLLLASYLINISLTFLLAKATNYNDKIMAIMAGAACLHLVFAAMISGGYGFPGASEYSKIILIVFAYKYFNSHASSNFGNIS